MNDKWDIFLRRIDRIVEALETIALVALASFVTSLVVGIVYCLNYLIRG